MRMIRALVAAVLISAPIACCSSPNRSHVESSSPGPSAGGYAPAPQPNQAQSDTHVPLIVEWILVGNRKSQPIVRIYEDGRVEASGDLLLGGPPLHAGQLSDRELALFRKRIERVAHGLPEREAVGTWNQAKIDLPVHKIRISRSSHSTAVFTTGMRHKELEGAQVPTLFSSLNVNEGGIWSELRGGSRFEAMHQMPIEHVAKRAVWLELEAELLRAVGESMLPEPKPRKKEQVPEAPDPG